MYVEPTLRQKNLPTLCEVIFVWAGDSWKNSIRHELKTDQGKYSLTVLVLILLITNSTLSTQSKSTRISMVAPAPPYMYALWHPKKQLEPAHAMRWHFPLGVDKTMHALHAKVGPGSTPIQLRSNRTKTEHCLFRAAVTAAASMLTTLIARATAAVAAGATWGHKVSSALRPWQPVWPVSLRSAQRRH